MTALFSVLLSILLASGPLAAAAAPEFPGTRGPLEKTVVPAAIPTSYERYGKGSSSRLAVLLTDPDSCWLGVAHGLKAIGVPFLITQDYKEALRHKVIFVYPIISGNRLTTPALKALAAFPRNGGTLIGSQVEGAGLEPVFGFKESVGSRSHAEIHFSSACALHYGLKDPREQQIRLGSATDSQDRIGAYAYLEPRDAPLATYEDGQAAIIHRTIGTGHAYALGLDLGSLFLKGYNNRDQSVERSYVNDFEPTIDIFLRLLRDIYQEGQPDAVTIAPVPNGKSLTVLLTHDIDFTRSVENAGAYAAYEKDQGIRATYFLQTKYIRDYNDDIFFNHKALPFLHRLIDMGMEVASHTVSHSKRFAHFPLGTGDEVYPDYQPFVRTAKVTENGSVLGELRVSKFLIESVAGLPPVLSFRPGDLADPYALPQALVATGYRYSSSATANNSLTHLPFQLNYGRETTSEVPVYEFPITIEDEADSPMIKRLPAAIALARKIAAYGGIVDILIHPNIIGQKLAFEEGFVEAFRKDAWFDTFEHFGAWWSARDHAGLDVTTQKAKHDVQIDLPEPLEGLTLRLPTGWILDHVLPPTVQARQEGSSVILGPAQSTVHLTFK